MSAIELFVKEQNRLASQENVKTSSLEMNVMNNRRFKKQKQATNEGSTSLQRTPKTNVARQRDDDKEKSPIQCGLIWVRFRQGRNTKPVNALCHAVAGPHVALPTCESNLSRVSAYAFGALRRGVRPCFM